MDESILLPSPNWFLVAGMAVSTDGWIFYGGPAKSLCILEPLGPNRNITVSEDGYRAHVFGKVHGEKITAVDLCPDWLEKKCFITGSSDGGVKLWSFEKKDKAVNIKYMYSHSLHSNEREDVVGVGYCFNNFAVTVGCNGKIVKWDLASNIVKNYDVMLAKFKPTCMACSPHAYLHVAVGTKQGVVIVLDLSDSGVTLFKVRSHDDEVLSVSWCPQYAVTVTKVKREFESRASANKRMERIRQEASKDEIELFDESALSKTLPDDSFDETIVEEEDLFDLYKDHEEDEFGHKKYIPEVIVVKEKEAKSSELDYLAECQKLKDKILKTKEEPEPSINSLVDALDKTHVDDKSCKSALKPQKKECSLSTPDTIKTSQNHTLASIGKHGQVRVWSKNGKILGSAIIQNKSNTAPKYHSQKINQPQWGTLLWYKPDILLITDARGQLLQCNPLFTDSRYRLQCSVIETIHKRGTFCIISNAPRVQKGHVPKDDNQIENGDQMQDVQVESDQQKHTHALPEDQWFVWTAAQDRTLVCYSITGRRKISTYQTCGGYIYNIQACPYDAKKIAVCVGDGAIRVWEADVDDDDDSKLSAGHVSLFWQNVQGKVLVTAWHPTKENVLAFGTAEARVGILDISAGSIEKPARVLSLGLSNSVYSVCWGDRNDLYVCGGGDVVMCRFRKDSEAKTISVELDGAKWRMTAANWYPCGLLVGSLQGAVALLCNTTHEILAVNFPFKKLINSIVLHPQFTSSSSEESALKNLVAVCSMDKNYKIAILKHTQNEEGKHSLETHKFLVGHKAVVMQLAWSPHDQGRLASTASDNTVRVWDVESGAATHIFWVAGNSAISVAWSAFPQLAGVLVTGGTDFAMRVWRLDDYPAQDYVDPNPGPPLTKKKERKLKSMPEKIVNAEEVGRRPVAGVKEVVETESLYGEGKEAERMTLKLKAFKKFLMPYTTKQSHTCTAEIVKMFARKQLGMGVTSGEEGSEPVCHTDFFKLFGTTNELNELLDLEMAKHLENGETEPWVMLGVFRGQMDAVVQFASQRDILCPFIVSLAPCVSFKYWKDVTQLYLAQVNRLVAQKREYKLYQVKTYGGAVFRKAALLLSLHDVKGAVDCLLEGRQYRDAYMLCRVRHMDSIAQDILRTWIKESLINGHVMMSVLCYIALGDWYKACTTLAGMSKADDPWLSVAAYLAKISGQHTLAGHLEDRKEQIKQTPNEKEIEKIEKTLEQLPSKIELLLKSNEEVQSDIKDLSEAEDDLGSENEIECSLKDDDDLKGKIGVKNVEGAGNTTEKCQGDLNVENGFKDALDNEDDIKNEIETIVKPSLILE